MPFASPTLTSDERDTAMKRQTLQNRINQRAFRSRRQEYVRDLEEQVRRFQQEGVQATKEVQIAARSVALENSLLRKLFKAYAHCNDRDIDMLLAHAGGENSAVRCSHGKTSVGNDSMQATLVPNTPSIASRQTSTQCESAQESTTTSLPAAPIVKPLQEKRASTTSKASHHSTRSKGDITLSFIDHGEVNLSTASIAPPSLKPNQDPSQNPATTLPVPPSRDSPQDSISCEEAASIIAGLRLQHGDEVREELGCTSQASCNIKNMVLLQLMNETF